MFPVTCDNQSKITINCQPDGKLDGPLRIEVLSGDGTFEQDANAPLSFKAVSGTDVFDATTSDTVGITVLRVSADVRTGPDELLIEEDVVLTVTAVPEPEATTLGFSVGAIEKK